MKFLDYVSRQSRKVSGAVKGYLRDISGASEEISGLNIKMGQLETDFMRQNDDLVEAIMVKQEAEKKTRATIQRTKRELVRHKEACEDYGAALLSGNPTYATEERTFGALNINAGLVRQMQQAQESEVATARKLKKSEGLQLETMFYSTIHRNKLNKFPTMAYVDGRILTTDRFDRTARRNGISISDIEKTISGDVDLEEAITSGKELSYICKNVGLTFVPGVEGISIAYVTPRSHFTILKGHAKRARNTVKKIYEGIGSIRGMELGLT